MGNFTIQKWRCDMCHKVHDTRPKVSPKVVVQARYSWPTVSGSVIDWTELCASCSDYTQRTIAAMIKEARHRREGANG